MHIEHGELLLAHLNHALQDLAPMLPGHWMQAVREDRQARKGGQLAMPDEVPLRQEPLQLRDRVVPHPMRISLLETGDFRLQLADQGRDTLNPFAGVVNVERHDPHALARCLTPRAQWNRRAHEREREKDACAGVDRHGKPRTACQPPDKQA